MNGRPLPPGNPGPGRPMQQQIDMRNSELGVCKNCGDSYFSMTYQMRILSPLMPENPLRKKILAHVQLWRCDQCRVVHTPDEIDVKKV